MKRAMLLAIVAVLLCTAAAPQPQGFVNRCQCLTFPLCWFVARYQPNGEPGDGQPEPLLWLDEVPRRAIAEFTSGYWSCSHGM